MSNQSIAIVHLNIDSLVDAYERRAQSTARNKAWEWLSEQTVVTFEGAALRVPSATWERTIYRATPERCTCPARGYCHHREAAIIVADARAEDAAIDAAAERETVRREMMELWA